MGRMSAPGAGGPAPIEAIDRAVSLLEALADAGPAGLSLAALVAATGTNKSTAYRAISTLRMRGHVTQDPLTGHYCLGPSAVALGERWRDHDQLQHLLRPALTAASGSTQELAHLGVLTGVDVVYIDKVEPERALRVWSRVGRTVPAAVTALGRSILAATPLLPTQLAPYLSGLDPAPDAGQVWDRIRQARELGHAREHEENEPGIACVGFAVVRGGAPVAALSITAPADRMTPARVDEVVATIRSTVPPLLPEGLSLAQPAML